MKAPRSELLIIMHRRTSGRGSGKPCGLHLEECIFQQMVHAVNVWIWIYVIDDVVVGGVDRLHGTTLRYYLLGLVGRLRTPRALG